MTDAELAEIAERDAQMGDDLSGAPLFYHDRRALLTELQRMREPCVWRYDAGMDEGGPRYDTGCNVSFATMLELPGYCCRCGHRIEVSK